ncbi:MAG: ABC transporter ATP-binding protein [Clostridiales bacterium]|nr:ABC transporter ATP-binding protein [Clostridiales bacterium]
MINIENLEVKYGNKKALSIEKLNIKKGEKIGVIGSNGAGKSTLIKALLEIVNYTGDIKKDIDTKDIAVHMQFNNYVETVSVKDIIELVIGDKIENNKIVQELIDFFDFKDSLNKKYNILSGGQKQRLTLILVMASNSPLTIFDEVTSGLDFETRQKLMKKLKEWYEDKDTTLILVSHYYEELENLVDKLLILDKGEVIAYGNKKDLFKKYCGNVVFIVNNTKNNHDLFKKEELVEISKEKLAIVCSDKKEEQRVINKLIEEDMDFTRTKSDIELIVSLARKD